MHLRSSIKIIEIWAGLPGLCQISGRWTCVNKLCAASPSKMALFALYWKFGPWHVESIGFKGSAEQMCRSVPPRGKPRFFEVTVLHNKKMWKNHWFLKHFRHMQFHGQGTQKHFLSDKKPLKTNGFSTFCQKLKTMVLRCRFFRVCSDSGEAWCISD